MILSNEKYYQRRWFLSFLFLIVGGLLIYTGIWAFRYNRTKDELYKSTTAPEKLWVQYSKNSDNKVLHIIQSKDKRAQSAILKERRFKVLHSILVDNGIHINNPNSFALTKKQIEHLPFEFWVWKDGIYEMNINNKTIIPFEKRSDSLGYGLVGIGILWVLFQIWVITTLIKRGKSVYDNNISH